MAQKIVELIDVQLLESQQLLNVFHFVSEDGTGDEATLVADYIANVVPLVVELQHENLTHVAIRHRQVYPTDTLTSEDPISPPVAGVITGSDALASCDAISVKFLPGATTVLAGGFTGHIKRSGARIGGIAEGEVVGNNLASGIAAEVATWFDELQNPNGGLWFLVVASFLSGNPPTRVRQTTVQSYAPIIGEVNPAPSTQNTRKVLRGRTF